MRIQRQRTAVEILLIVTAVVFFFQLMSGSLNYKLINYGCMHWPSVVAGQVWRLLTYAFLHGSIPHFIFNMLGLWMFGRILEWHWGSRKFLLFYLLTAIFSAIISGLGHFATGSMVPSIGASGAIMAILVVFAAYYPYEKIYLFAIVPVEARFAIPGFALLSVYFLTSGSMQGIDHFGHLGGIVAGLLYYILEHSVDKFLGDINFFIKRRLPKKKTNNLYEFKAPKKKSIPTPKDELDRLLKKVSQHGVDSLSENERALLEKFSKEMRK